MMSPRDLVKVAGFGRSVDICVITVHDVVVGGGGDGTGRNGRGCQVIVVHLGLVEDAGFSSSSRCSVVFVHLAVCPLCVAQESGFQCRVQLKEGLDQRRLRL